MALLNRFKQMLISEERGKKKKYQTEKQDADNYDTLPVDEKQINMPQSDRQVRITKLTPREHELYLLLIEGVTLKESAKQLSIKYSTANTHMSGIYKKLGVNSRVEMIINYRGINGG